jgi:hypothetical protein
VDSLDELSVSIDVRLRRDAVMLVVVVGSKINDDKIGWEMLLEVPRLGIIYSLRSTKERTLEDRSPSKLHSPP